MARFEVGDNVMVLTEGIRGRKGIIQRILNDNLQDDPKGSRFIVQTEGSDKFNMISVRDIAWINHAEDEKNKTGYYTEAAQEILSKEPLFIAGDVVAIRNDMGPIEYAIKESKRVDNVIDGGIYPVYQYQMVLVNDEYADNFHPDVCMCEEYDLVFQRHDEMLEQYFTEGKIPDSAKLEPKFTVGDVVSGDGYKNYIVTEIREFDCGIDKRYEYVVLPLDYHDGNESIVIKESDASFRYHDKTWEEYFTESVRNELPAWRGKLYNLFALYTNFEAKTTLDSSLIGEYENDTIPVHIMEHIIDKHSMYGAIKRVLGNNCTTENARKIREHFKLSVNELKEFRASMLNKIDKINLTGVDSIHQRKPISKDFTSKEWDLIKEIDKLDIVNGVPISHYTATMSNLQIMEAIREAYETAQKNGALLIGTDTDLRTDENFNEVKGHRKYKGVSDRHKLVICFLYSYDMNIITTAYPVGTTNNSKKY